MYNLASVDLLDSALISKDTEWLVKLLFVCIIKAVWKRGGL